MIKQYLPRKVTNRKWSCGLIRQILFLRKGEQLEFYFYDEYGIFRKKIIKCEYSLE